VDYLLIHRGFLLAAAKTNRSWGKAQGGHSASHKA